MSSLRQKIAAILDLPDVEAWQIIDTNIGSGLYLIHYTPDASMVKYGSLRGVVVDINAKIIVARSYGYTPVITTNSLHVAEYDQKIHLIDAYNPNVDYELDPKRITLLPGFDGKIIRVFLHNGQVYHSTYRRLNANQASWGDSPSFTEIYNQLGGPKDDQLFDLSKKYSPYVHIFILADPNLQLASKTQLGAGYLVYLGPRKMWETSSYPKAEVDFKLHTFTTTNIFTPNPDTPVLYSPPEFNLEQGEKFLQFGFNQPFDPSGLEERLFPGEFLIAYTLNQEDEITGVIRIESPSYRWRSNIRDNNPDLLYQFYILSNGKFIQAQNRDEQELYISRFPILTPYDQESIDQLIAENGPIIVWPQEDMTEEVSLEILNNSNSRLYNIFLDFVYALPPSQQESVLDFYTYYQNSLEDIIAWLIGLYEKGNLEYQHVPARGRQIISLARGFARTKLDQGLQQDLDTIVGEEIDRLVKQEEGGSLYRLMQDLPKQT